MGLTNKARTLAWDLRVQGLPDRCLDPRAQGLGMKQRPGHQSWPSPSPRLTASLSQVLARVPLAPVAKGSLLRCFQHLKQNGFQNALSSLRALLGPRLPGEESNLKGKLVQGWA